MSSLAANDQGALSALRAALKPAKTSTEALDYAMAYLHEHRLDYHWVGIYRLEGDTLVLGPYRGPETDHVRIPVGRGVCGTAVAENKNQVIGDVRSLDNYLACNLGTRSELVVLIRDPQTAGILGQIDIDGSKLNQFIPTEVAFIEAVAEVLAPYLSLRQ